ncbi:hypothetical protein D3C75_697540 [compost metagenome]
MLWQYSTGRQPAAFAALLQEGHRFPVDQGGADCFHRREGVCAPAELRTEQIHGEGALHIRGGSDHRMTVQQLCNQQCQPVGPAQVTGEHADHMFSLFVYDEDGGVGFFIHQQGSNQPDRRP